MKKAQTELMGLLFVCTIKLLISSRLKFYTFLHDRQGNPVLDKEVTNGNRYFTE
jgi:hypothetical protein